MRTYLLAILISATSFYAYAGGISSTGGENHASSDGAAWFIGEKPVRYCIELNASFGVSKSEAAIQISNVFSAWRDYIAKKGLNSENRFDTDSDIDKSFKLGKIAMNTSQMDACDGSEDLKFYFGVDSEEVRRYIKTFTEPVAFAQRTKFDEERGWGKGFIWVQMPGIGRIKDDVWKKPFLLYGVLLHEVGHVLGNSHIGNTIMDESVPALAGEGGIGKNDEAYFTHIDNRRELFFCKTCDFEYRGQTGSMYSDMFELLTGRNPAGEVTSRLYSQNMPSLQPKIVLELRDAKGLFTFELGHEYILSHLTLAFGDTPVFKKSVNHFGWGRRSDAATYLLSIKTKKGKKLPVLMARNMGVSPMTLQLLSVKPGWVPEFFYAETYR